MLPYMMLECYMDDFILDLYYHVIFMFYLDIIILCCIFVFMLYNVY